MKNGNYSIFKFCTCTVSSCYNEVFGTKTNHVVIMKSCIHPYYNGSCLYIIYTSETVGTEEIVRKGLTYEK